MQICTNTLHNICLFGELRYVTQRLSQAHAAHILLTGGGAYKALQLSCMLMVDYNMIGGGHMPRKILETQGDEISIDGLEDVIYTRREDGQLVRLEVDDDATDD